jgi:predicted nucleic acid-binding protein
VVSKKCDNLFWDSCVFIAFLNNESSAYDINSIEQYLSEARSGLCRIYSSTVALAEVRPSFLVRKSIGSFSEFVDDLGGAVVLIDPNPNLMDLSGRLRDLSYQKSNSKKRTLATPDAIMLATAVHLEDDLSVELTHFHTFDKGRKRGDEGKSVPLLTYEEWCEGLENDELAQRVIALPRCAPIHPTPVFSMGH